MLHEAATINKAIEQAWCDAGKPSEFTIKVLDAGKKGILWFSKRPAIISISYDPKTVTEVPPTKQSGKSASRNNRSRNKNSRDRDNNRDNNKDRNNRGKRSVDDRSRSNTRNKEQSNNKNSNKTNHTSSDQNKNTGIKDTPAPKKEASPSLNVWSPEAVDYVRACLQDITSIAKIASKFSTKAEKKVLTITFDEKVHSSTDEERMLFISLSYILMQFLKKKFKKKFRGFQLMLNTKAAVDSNANKESSSS